MAPRQENPAGSVNQFRKFARFIVLFLLFGALIVSFAFWGIGDMLRTDGRSSEVAHVGSTRIPLYGWVGGTPVSVTEVRDQLTASSKQSSAKPDSVRSRNRLCVSDFTFGPLKK